MTFRRLFTLAGLAAALLFATGASSQAAYTLTQSAITTTPSPAVLGGTTFTFTPSGGGSQSGSTTSNFNTIDVGVSSTTAPPAFDSGTINYSQTLSFTGSPGTETFSFTGTITLLTGNTGGVASTGTGTVTQISGSGYQVFFAGYAPPSPGSGSGPTVGNLSILVIPAVPEPASVVMMGSGLVGVVGLGLRRMRKA